MKPMLKLIQCFLGVVMILLVVAGTIFDVLHKKSARYFSENMRKQKANARRSVGGGEMVSNAVKTAVVDVATSGEFCNQKRRIAHLLTMYGFIAFALATAVMIYAYPTAADTPAIWPMSVATGSGSLSGSTWRPRASRRSGS